MNNDKAIINIDIWLLLFCNYLDDIKLFSLKEKSKKELLKRASKWVHYRFFSQRSFPKGSTKNLSRI